MKRIISLLIIGGLFFSFGSLAYGLSNEELKKLPHISAQKAYALFLQKKILLIDVHPGGPEKKQAEILGAHYLPSQVIAKKKVKLPKNIIIGVFCR